MKDVARVRAYASRGVAYHQAFQAHGEIPKGLTSAIQDGQCVAFVGAGFSAAANLPPWGKLLELIAATEGVPDDVRAHVATKVKEGGGHALDEAAQVLEDAMTRKVFVNRLGELLGSPEMNVGILQRLRWLKGIPFRAILTTNFDGVLDGNTTSPEAYRSVLRPSQYRWWEEGFLRDTPKGATTLKLHGDVRVPASLVFTRLDYRRRLYHDIAYMSFLRATMAEQTILYLGFSFADAYLNEIRSEILALLGQGTASAPLAYAVINDIPETTRKHFLKNEGVEIITYDTKTEGYAGFERILQAIHDRTNTTYRFAQLTSGKRILWVDSNPSNQSELYGFIARAGKLGGVTGCTIDEARHADEGIALMEKAGAGNAPFDLVITHWGHRGAKDGAGRKIPVAERLLREMRARDLCVPLLIFAGPTDIPERKKKALGLGAQGYYYTYGGILRGIERVFTLEGESV